MTENIFQKDLWDDDDWDIYFNNLDILRHLHGLSKKGLAESINRANLYRKDINHPGEATITRLCGKFNVTESWLSTPRLQAGKKEGLTTNQGVVEYPNLSTDAQYVGEDRRKEQRRKVGQGKDVEDRVLMIERHLHQLEEKFIELDKENKDLRAQCVKHERAPGHFGASKKEGKM